MRELLGLGLLALGLGAGIAAPGQAQETDDPTPVLLNADELVYDEELGVVTAMGHVELAQGLRVVFADRLTYNERTNVVTATGNVSLLEPNGDVIFAEYAEMTNDLAQGFVDQVRVLMTDNSRIAATEGERTDDGRFLRLNRAVYSPCNLCPKDPAAPPLWQVRAGRVVHDKEEQEVVYRDAILEMFGLPVFYTPYLSHPDPTVEQKSGFLAPSFGFSSNIGSFASVPYYWAIAPNEDATITPTYSTDDGLHLLGEYRRRFESGVLTLEGSVVQADRREAAGVRADQWRGHLFGFGRFDLSDVWRVGFDVEHTSDETYLKRYGISAEDILTSRVFVEGFRGRNYAVANAYRFQDLRPGIIERKPLVVPLAEVSLLGEPTETFGGRWSLDLGLVGLVRENGRDTRRASATVGWERDFLSNAGIVTTVEASLRSDAYYVTDFVPQGAPVGSPTTSEATLRLFPQSQVTVRYPLAKRLGSFRQVFEPMAALTLAPRLEDDSSIPNEDVLDIELSPTTLFRPNRFPGYDRLDSGSRITYGINNGLYGDHGGRAELFLGQSFHLTSRNDYFAGTGLEDDFSDIVGRLVVSPNNYFDLRYQFRLDDEDLEPRVHDATVTAGVPVLRVGANYYYSSIVDGSGLPRDSEYLTAYASSSFTDYWSASFSQSYNFQTTGNSLLSASAILTYADECFTFQVIGTRDYTSRSDIESGDTLFFRFVFKNLGEFETPVLSGAASTANPQ